ncbi:hypothetical protein B0H11DRAFT_2219072 [Mycena galericulata]|nr:hypothetical protein B0H11DRAFT_2219072 [Mycena galericulata]
MPSFSSLWRRKDDSPTLPYTAKQGQPIDKASIGRPVLRTIPRRFERYASDYTRAHLTRSTSHRSGSLSSSAVLRPPVLPPPTAHSPPPEREKSPYPLIRSYSLPNSVCPSLSTSNWSRTTLFLCASRRRSGQFMFASSSRHSQALVSHTGAILHFAYVTQAIESDIGRRDKGFGLDSTRTTAASLRTTHPQQSRGPRGPQPLPQQRRRRSPMPHRASRRSTWRLIFPDHTLATTETDHHGGRPKL